jgi:hypothetical protein
MYLYTRIVHVAQLLMTAQSLSQFYVAATVSQQWQQKYHCTYTHSVVLHRQSPAAAVAAAANCIIGAPAIVVMMQCRCTPNPVSSCTDAKASGHTGPETKQPSPADYGTVGASHVWGAAHHTSSAPSDGSAAHKPPTSAFEAAGAVPLEADATAVQDQQHKVEPSSPHRPPLHPVKHAGRALCTLCCATIACCSQSRLPHTVWLYLQLIRHLNPTQTARSPSSLAYDTCAVLLLT